MKSLLIYIVACVSLISCDDEIKLPEIEECTILSRTAICTDKRLPDNEQEYRRYFSEMRAYQCTNPSDYKEMQNKMEDLLKELATLRRRCSKFPEESPSRHPDR